MTPADLKERCRYASGIGGSLGSWYDGPSRPQIADAGPQSHTYFSESKTNWTASSKCSPKMIVDFRRDLPILFDFSAFGPCYLLDCVYFTQHPPIHVPFVRFGETSTNFQAAPQLSVYQAMWCFLSGRSERAMALPLKYRWEILLLSNL